MGFDPRRTQAGLGSAYAANTGVGQDLDPHEQAVCESALFSCYHETVGIYTRARVFSRPQGHAGVGETPNTPSALLFLPEWAPGWISKFTPQPSPIFLWHL